MTVPVSLWVCALNALQNSMMLIPCWPSAGPTGGAGLACPALACSLIVVRTFLAISYSAYLWILRGDSAVPGRGAARLSRWRIKRDEDAGSEVCSAHERPRTQYRADHRPAQSFFTWSNPTSTGVSLPKIDTSTLSRAASSLISEISPEKSDRGPETTLTDSPIVNWARARVAVATSLCSSRSTSPWVRGTGSWEEPTKPVTPGVPLTTPQESSLSSMLTSTYPGMVRFSTVTFWLSFISETASVGTTTERTARCCPSDTTRCSRLCLTLFSWPEYVLTTYQRNIQKLLHEDGARAPTRPLIRGSSETRTQRAWRALHASERGRSIAQ